MFHGPLAASLFISSGFGGMHALFKNLKGKKDVMVTKEVAKWVSNCHVLYVLGWVDLAHYIYKGCRLVLNNLRRVRVKRDPFRSGQVDSEQKFFL